MIKMIFIVFLVSMGGLMVILRVTIGILGGILRILGKMVRIWGKCWELPPLPR